MIQRNNTKLSALIIALITFAASVFVSCAEGAGGSSVGGTVIEAPEKLLEGDIVGHVTHDGKPIAGAKIIVKGHNFSAVTDNNGRFRIEFKAMAKMGVVKKRVQLEISAEGFRTRTKGVYVEQKRITTITVELLPPY